MARQGKRIKAAASDTLSPHVLVWLLGMCSVATVMVLVNKHVFRQIPCPCLVTGLQNAATVLINLGATSVGIFEMKQWQLGELKQFVVQGALFAATLGLSNFGLPRVATSTLIVPKSLTTIFCMWAESWLGMATFGQTAHVALITSFGGSVLYAMSDEHYESAGYLAFLLVSLLNCLVSVYERTINLSIEQTAVGCSCYKNVVSVPFFIVFALLTGEHDKIQQVALSWELCGLVFLSTILGFGLSLCYASLYKITSATTVLAAANLNKLATSVVGSQVFVEHTSRSAGVGILLSLGGVIVYAMDKARMDVFQPQIFGSGLLLLCLGVFMLIGM